MILGRDAHVTFTTGFSGLTILHPLANFFLVFPPSGSMHLIIFLCITIFAFIDIARSYQSFPFLS